MGRQYNRLQKVIGADLLSEHKLTKEEITRLESDGMFSHLVDHVMERGYLNGLSQRTDFTKTISRRPSALSWVQLLRLPVPPHQMEEYHLLDRWQSALAALHSWNRRLVFFLVRQGGVTSIYLGSASANGETMMASQAGEQLKQALSSSMPGIGLESLSSRQEIMDNIGDALLQYPAVGAITGIPSVRKDTRHHLLQTLDSLAFGVRDNQGNEVDYSLMVVADPIADPEVAEIISSMRGFVSDIHAQIKTTRGVNTGENLQYTIGLSADVFQLITKAAGKKMAGGKKSTGGGLGVNASSARTFTLGQSENREYINAYAQYAKDLVEKHIERMKRGRNLGLWNAGVYVMSRLPRDTETVLGLLRSLYSGDESYIEPIRTHCFQEHSGAVELIRNFGLIPLNEEDDQWHLFGKTFQYVSTPLNTEELSLATSLPRRDVPGIRFVKTAVRFANNTAESPDTAKAVLGNVIDTGVVQSIGYHIPIHSLVRHGLIAGVTGSGKTTTSWKLVEEVLREQIPVLIIEPAKDDYVRRALEYNRAHPDLPEEQKFAVYMPGRESFEGTKVLPLKLNPFQPAVYPGAKADVLTHLEQMIQILNTSLPNSDVLPILIEETLFEYARAAFPQAFSGEDVALPPDFPRLEGARLKARQILEQRGYDKKVQDDLAAAMDTRFAHLLRGKRGRILNVNSSSDWTGLFGRPAVVNLSRLGSSFDKSLISALLMLALYEYRISAYHHSGAVLEQAQKNRLLHLAVVEEAHNILQKTGSDANGTGSAQNAMADMFANILSEIRGFGQGILLVDQIPSRLIPDAVKNTNYKFVHRMIAPDDIATMASSLSLRPEQADVISSLGIGNMLVCGDMDDAAAWVKVSE